NYLNGAAAIPSSGPGPGDVWAVGQYNDPDTGRRTLIERYSPCPGSPTPAATATTATRTATSVQTETPTAIPTLPATPMSTLTAMPTLTTIPSTTPARTAT